MLASYAKGRTMKTRNALLFVTVALLSSMLSLALPNLGVEISGAEELAQTRTLTFRPPAIAAASPRRREPSG